jgi:thioesterase domain-containing protein
LRLPALRLRMPVVRLRLPAVSASSGVSLSPATNTLFARAVRGSERVILPINDSAMRNEAPSPAFYCVHSVTGAAGTDFLNLAQRLDRTVGFYGVQAPPKLMQDLEFGGSIESLANHYTKALVKFQPEGRLMLGGYCIGAVIALEMAKLLRAMGREIGPIVAIDGAPENVGSVLTRWRPRYWLEMAGNVPRWIMHADLMRSRSLHSLLRSLRKHAVAIGKSAVGLRQGEKLGGGYAIDRMMDLSLYPPAQRLFINRLYAAMFAYVPEPYAGEVAVYEARVTPLMSLPQIGRVWRKLAPQAEIVSIVGTHIGMMHEPYVDALAEDVRARVIKFFSVKNKQQS